MIVLISTVIDLEACERPVLITRQIRFLRLAEDCNDICLRSKRKHVQLFGFFPSHFVQMYELTQVLFLAGNVATHTLIANQIHSATDIKKTLGLLFINDYFLDQSLV